MCKGVFEGDSEEQGLEVWQTVGSKSEPDVTNPRISGLSAMRVTWKTFFIVFAVVVFGVVGAIAWTRRFPRPQPQLHIPSSITQGRSGAPIC